MMNTSEHIDQIATALAKAQTQIEHASKDRTNPAFRQSYATLAAVDDAARPHLAANGIAVVSAPTYDDARKVVTVETRLIHASGQWLATSCSAPVAKADAQGIGSAITYLRRYTLSALAGVAPGDDDDGNAAVGRGNQSDDRRPEPKRDEPRRQEAPPRERPLPVADAAQTERPAPSDPLATLAALGWDRLALGCIDISTSDAAAVSALIARARGGWRPDNKEAAKADDALHLVTRRLSRVREAKAAGILTPVVEENGKPSTWTHEKCNALKASIAAAGGAA